MIHPDYRVKIDEFDDKVYRCAWCATNKKEITIETTDGKPQYSLTKKEAEQAYHRYLNKLTQDPKIRKLLAKGNDNPLDELKG
jgi:hypothetical protein